MADDLVHPATENFKPMITWPVKPVKIPQMIETAQVVAGDGDHLNIGLAENGLGTRHVACAGDEKQSLQTTLLHQRRDLESLVMRVTANSEAVQLDFEMNVISKVVANCVRLRKRPALMWISATSQDQKWSLPRSSKRESCAESVRSNFQMKSRGL